MLILHLNDLNVKINEVLMLSFGLSISVAVVTYSRLSSASLLLCCVIKEFSSIGFGCSREADY